MSIYGDNIFNESSNDARRKAMEFKKKMALENRRKLEEMHKKRTVHANRSNAISKVITTLNEYIKDKKSNSIVAVVDNFSRSEFNNNKSNMIKVKLVAKKSNSADIDKINNNIKELVSNASNIGSYLNGNIRDYRISCYGKSSNELDIYINL